MRRSFFAHQRVLARPHGPALQQLLKGSLEVRELSGRFPNLRNLLSHQSFNDAPRSLKARVQVYGAKDRLESVNKQRLLLAASCLLFPFAQVKVSSEVELLRVSYKVR